MGGHVSGRGATLFAALVIVACGAESQTPELRPEFMSLCGASWTITPGLEQCDGNVRHRSSAVSCPADYPGTRGHLLYQLYSAQTNRGLAPECATDSECNAAPNGFCSGTFDVPMQCTYGCSADEDCAPGEACACGAAYGECVPANCRGDASCAPGYACTSWDDDCGGRGFACETPEDECWSNAECGEGRICAWDGSRRVCDQGPACSDAR